MTNVFRQCVPDWIPRLVLVLGVGLLTTTAGTLAQQPPSEDEDSQASDNPYHKLRRSEDRSTALLAERYFALIRAQEWTDANGKKVMAKYKSHDPNLQWVKLEVARGQGADRVVKEFQYPVAKLSKASQSRVKQIDTVQKRLDEKLAAAPAGEDAAGASQPQSSDPNAPMQEERREETRTARRGREAPSRRREPGVPAAPPGPTEQAATAAEPFDPDPLGFAEMDLTPPAVPAEAAPPGATEAP